MSSQSGNSGMGVVIGILLAVFIGFAVYYFMNQGGVSSPDISINTPGGSISADIKD